MNSGKNKTIIAVLFALSLFIACTSLAVDRIVFGYISILALPLDPDSKNIKLLNVGHYKQSTPYTCGPAAVMNLMFYYKMLSTKEMNQRTEMRIASEMGANDEGTSSLQMVAWLTDHGFHVEYGRTVSSDYLISNIKKGYPVIIAYSNHWMLANGYENSDSATNTFIIFSDTGSGHTRVNRDEIDSMWAVSKLLYRNKGDAGYYILAVPYKNEVSISRNSHPKNNHS